MILLTTFHSLCSLLPVYFYVFLYNLLILSCCIRIVSSTPEISVYVFMLLICMPIEYHTILLLSVTTNCDTLIYGGKLKLILRHICVCVNQKYFLFLPVISNCVQQQHLSYLFQNNK